MAAVRLLARHVGPGRQLQRVGIEPFRRPRTQTHHMQSARSSVLSVVCLHSPSRALSTSRSVLKPPSPDVLALSVLNTEKDHALAREWLDEFVPEDIPKDAYEVSYARSSGPGGQHVNKTNSKAVVHCNIHKGRWLPPFVVAELQKTSYYHPPNLLFSSQTSRSAPQNLAAALALMHEVIVKAGRAPVRGETSEKTKERVRDLAKAEQARRRTMKEKQKNKKADRRKDW